MINIEMNIESSGPVFDGRAEAEVTRFTDHITEVLGDDAVGLIRAYLPTQYKYLGNNGGTPEFNPVPPGAGLYQSGIHTDRQTPDRLFVHDTPVVYGPWLEGVSSRNLIVWPHKRNPPPRRFPGYHTFRIIAQFLNSRAGSIAEREIHPYIQEMNS